MDTQPIERMPDVPVMTDNSSYFENGRVYREIRGYRCEPSNGFKKDVRIIESEPYVNGRIEEHSFDDHKLTIRIHDTRGKNNEPVREIAFNDHDGNLIDVTVRNELVEQIMHNRKPLGLRDVYNALPEDHKQPVHHEAPVVSDVSNYFRLLSEDIKQRPEDIAESLKTLTEHAKSVNVGRSA